MTIKGKIAIAAGASLVVGATYAFRAVSSVKIPDIDFDADSYIGYTDEDRAALAEAAAADAAAQAALRAPTGPIHY